MKPPLFSLLLALVLTLSAALGQEAPVAGSADAEAEQAITRLRDGMVESFNRNDIDGLLEFLDPEAVVTWQDGEVCSGVAAVKAYHVRMMNGDKRVVEKVTAAPEILGRRLQGDWAVSWGTLNDHFVLMDGRDLALNSQFTATLARRADGWRVTAIHLSVNAFENPVLSLAVRSTALTSAGVGAVAVLLVGGLVMIWRRRGRTAGG